VHLWDYCRTEADRRYINSVANLKARYKIFVPLGSVVYIDAYKSIASSDIYRDDDILIKADDDIVYIDIKKFDYYIGRIRDNGLYYPNVVNNDVMALVQHYHKVHSHIFSESEVVNWQSPEPLSNWYAKSVKAIGIHALFTEYPKKFTIELDHEIPWRGRISINMFGAKYSVLKTYLKIFSDNDLRDDERYLSFEVYDTLKNLHNISHSNYIVPSFVCVHFSFGPQEEVVAQAWFLETYKTIATELEKIDSK
jgi:hypothetical protein